MTKLLAYTYDHLSCIATVCLFEPVSALGRYVKVLLEKAGFCNVSVEKNGTLFCVTGKVPA